VPASVQQELVALAGRPGFSGWLDEALSLAFERHEPATARPEYAGALNRRLREVLGEALADAAWTDRRQAFFRDYVTEGLAAGSDASMLVRRMTFLMTLVASELSRSVPAVQTVEAARWLAGLSAGFVCDVVSELNRQRALRAGGVPSGAG
jgi:hypothetical protein